MTLVCTNGSFECAVEDALGSDEGDEVAGCCAVDDNSIVFVKIFVTCDGSEDLIGADFGTVAVTVMWIVLFCVSESISRPGSRMIGSICAKCVRRGVFSAA